MIVCGSSLLAGFTVKYKFIVTNQISNESILKYPCIFAIGRFLPWYKYILAFDFFCQTITDYRGLIAAQYPGDSTAGSLVRLLMEQRSPVVVTIHPLIELHSVRFTYHYFSGIYGTARKNISYVHWLTSSGVKINPLMSPM